MDWIELPQDRDRWLAPVSAVMNLWGFHKMWGISWLAENRLASCSKYSTTNVWCCADKAAAVSCLSSPHSGLSEDTSVVGCAWNSNCPRFEGCWCFRLQGQVVLFDWSTLRMKKFIRNDGNCWPKDSDAWDALWIYWNIAMWWRYLLRVQLVKYSAFRTDRTAVCVVFIVLYCTVLYCTALHCTALYCTALHCTVLYCTALHCTVEYCPVLYCTVLYSIALYSTVMYCIALLYSTLLYRSILHCTVLYCTVLYSIVLYCTVLHRTVL